MEKEQYNVNEPGTSLDRIHEFFRDYAERIKKTLNEPDIDRDDKCTLQGALQIAQAVVEIIEMEQEMEKI